tara:strand:- start:4546 stop:4665 length:120 start_codon:yes stop_codon:yes gene_type:complete
MSIGAQSIEENKTYLLMMKDAQPLISEKAIKGKGIEGAA